MDGWGIEKEFQGGVDVGEGGVSGGLGEGNGIGTREWKTDIWDGHADHEGQGGGSGLGEVERLVRRGDGLWFWGRRSCAGGGGKEIGEAVSETGRGAVGV